MRQAADLVELVRGQVQLVRRGGRWVGRCPFHEERTPSFSIIPPDNRSYYCFGCGASGDAIDWMREREGAGSFAEAVEAPGRALRGAPALRAGEPPGGGGAAPPPTAARTCSSAPPASTRPTCGAPTRPAPAREYLLGRGFDEALLRRFRVGFAPTGGIGALRPGPARGLLARPAGRGRPGAAARRRGPGLLPGPHHVPDRRRAGAACRASAPGPWTPTSAPSTSTPPRARASGSGGCCSGCTWPAPRPRGRAGSWWPRATPTCWRLVAAGVEAAVACMGTSLTSEQLRARCAARPPEVRLCFDADEAGQAAAWRTVEAAEGIHHPFVRSATAERPGSRRSGAPPQNDQTILRRVVEAPKPLVACLIDVRGSRVRAGRRASGAALDRDHRSSFAGSRTTVEKDEGVRVATSGSRAVPGHGGAPAQAVRDRRAPPRAGRPGASSPARGARAPAADPGRGAARARGPLPGPAAAREPERGRTAGARGAAGRAARTPSAWPPELAALGAGPAGRGRR